MPRTANRPFRSIARRTRLAALAVLAVICAVVLPTTANAIGTAPTLGMAESFAVLAASTVTNTDTFTVVSGDLGVSNPGSEVTGFPPGVVVDGTIHEGDAVAAQADANAQEAFNFLAGQTCETDLTGQDLGVLTLTAGVYCFSSEAFLTGTLTLDAQGDPDAVFIFQIGSTLITASGSSVMLINEADACNVFFQVGSSATLGTNTTFVGTILASESITANSGATVDGRLLALNGAVTLDDNLITAPDCTDTGTTDGTDGTTDTGTTDGTDGTTDTGTTDGTDGTTDTGTTDGTDGTTDTGTTDGTDGTTDTGTTDGTDGTTDTGTTDGTDGTTDTGTTDGTDGTTDTGTTDGTTDDGTTEAGTTDGTAGTTDDGTTDGGTTDGAIVQGGVQRGSITGGAVTRTDLPRTGSNTTLTLVGTLAVVLGAAAMSLSNTRRGTTDAGTTDGAITRTDLPRTGSNTTLALVGTLALVLGAAAMSRSTTRLQSARLRR